MKMKDENLVNLADPGMFCEVFGDTPRNRILEFFLAMRDVDYGIADVARNLEMNKVTAYNVTKELIKKEILVPYRILGRTQTYKLNKKNKIVKIMLKAFDMLIDLIAKEHMVEKIIVKH